MTKTRICLLISVSILCVLFSGCVSVNVVAEDDCLITIKEAGHKISAQGTEYSNSNEKTSTSIFDEDDKTPNSNASKKLASIDGSVVFIDNYGKVDLDDFLSNPTLTPRENENIKRIILSTILFTFDLEEDIGFILASIDEEQSKKWYAEVFASWIEQSPEERKNWTVVNAISYIRYFNISDETILSNIHANFMIRSSMTSENRLYISVPVERTCINGLTFGYMLYDFVLQKTNGVFKVIGLSLGA